MSACVYVDSAKQHRIEDTDAVRLVISEWLADRPPAELVRALHAIDNVVARGWTPRIECETCEHGHRFVLVRATGSPFAGSA